MLCQASRPGVGGEPEVTSEDSLADDVKFVSAAALVLAEVASASLDLSEEPQMVDQGPEDF